jgi:DNA-3-methyladenine glycosylase I
MIAYHDQEWGVPLRDDRALFELLILEGAQAGLSWSTILRKRLRYRAAFEGFDPARVARYGDRQVARLMSDAGIVRNRLKIQAAIANARLLPALVAEFGSFDHYLWRFAPARHARPRTAREVPVTTPESDALAADLRRRGFRFVGSTIIYAFMQAAGLVDDHLTGCFRARGTVKSASAARTRSPRPAPAPSSRRAAPTVRSR